MIKYVFTLIVIFPLLTLGCASQQKTSSTDTSSATALELERPIPYNIHTPDAFQLAIDRGTRTISGEPGPEYWQNSASYTISAELFPEDFTVHANSLIVYENNSPNTLDMIVIELAQNLHKQGSARKETAEITGGLELLNVEVSGSAYSKIIMAQRYTQQATGYIIDGTRMFLFPDTPVESGSAIEIEFEWSFMVPQAGASGRMGYSRDNLFFIAYWYPQIAVYDDVYGWMDDPFLGNAEFYHMFADYELEITAPQKWIVMATGEFLNPDETLSSPTLKRYQDAAKTDEIITVADFNELHEATLSGDDEGKLTWKFRSKNIRDVAFSATLESRWDATRTAVGDLNGDGSVNYSRINTFYRDSAPLWREQTRYAQHSIQYLSGYTQLNYPWPHMTSVEGADIIGGGMEFPMMTIIGDYNNAGAVRLYGVTAHELAHMWFPMLLSTNERRYTWIDEGYTTFHTHKANLDFYGADRFTNSNLFGRYLQIAGSDLEGEIMRWSDLHRPGPAYGVASYPKPASILAALEGLLGTDIFVEAHHTFIQEWAYKHPYPWDIFNTFERVSGRDLNWFWQSWYYETWVLDQSISDVREDQGRTIIIVDDIGNVPMPVHLLIKLENGNEIEKKIPVDNWLRGLRTAEVTIESESKITLVEIDPEMNFPDSDRSNNIWVQK